MINKLKTEVCKVEVYSYNDIKNGQPNALPATGYNRNLNFISVGLDPFTQGTSLVIQHCILRTMLQKQ
jgi:hypothetical protein